MILILVFSNEINKILLRHVEGITLLVCAVYYTSLVILLFPQVKTYFNIVSNKIDFIKTNCFAIFTNKNYLLLTYIKYNLLLPLIKTDFNRS